MTRWFKDPVPNLLAGLVMALVLIPEAIGFSGIAGVAPSLGLYAAFFLSITVAVFGSRIAMITSASGSTAVLMTALVNYGMKHGGQNTGEYYVIIAGLFAGIFQILLSFVRISSLMRFVPKAAVSGFVNALALLILQSEFPQLGFSQFFGIDRHSASELGSVPSMSQLPIVWVLVVLGLVIIYGFPRLTKKIPSQLVAIFLITIICFVFHIDIPKVGDLGALPASIQFPSIPFGPASDGLVPFEWKSFYLIIPTSIAISLVALLETFLTQSYLDELTETKSSKKIEGIAQGFGNIVSSLFGGMAGCALVGESVTTVKNGASTRLATFFTGLSLILMIILGRDVISEIPMAAVVAVMISIAAITADTDSIVNLNSIPKTETVIMFITFIVTMSTHPHNLALGVIAGVVVAQLIKFVRRRNQS